MDNVKEVHKTYLFGKIPWTTTYVYPPSNETEKRSTTNATPRTRASTSEDNNSHETNSTSQFPIDDYALVLLKENAGVLIMVVSLIFVLLAYYAAQYIAIQNCPQKFDLDNKMASLRKCEAKFEAMEIDLNRTREQNEELKREKAKLTTNNAELERKGQKIEKELSSVRAELESTKEQEKKLQEENLVLKSEKESQSNDLSATRYTLGNCKNKNMDHEVRSLELLEEIEALKKELKACT